MWLLSNAPRLRIGANLLVTVFLGFTKDPYPGVRKAALDGLSKASEAGISVCDVGIVEGCFSRAVELLGDAEDEIRVAAIRVVDRWGQMLAATKSESDYNDCSDFLFIQLCSMTLTKLRFSRNTVTETGKEKFKELLQGDEFYRVRLPSNVLSPPGRNYTMSFIKAVTIVEGNGSDVSVTIMLYGPNTDYVIKRERELTYLLTVDIARGYLHKSLSATLEFIIESGPVEHLEHPVSSELVIFYITQDTQRHPLLPELKSSGFKVTGKIPTQCSLTDPLSGDLTVEASSGSIESIDIHLIRVESILVGERTATETSVIQTTQIADGDVCRGRSLPIHVILPRLLTCPTVLAGPFSIEFKVYIVITFKSELSKLHPKPDPRTPRLWTASENFPLELVRTR